MEILKLSKFKLSVSGRTLIDNTDGGSCDLSICSGELTLIVGTNGSGKTTLMKKIIGTSDTKIRKKLFHLTRKERAFDGVSLDYGKPFFNGEPIKGGILDEVGFAPNDSDLKLVVDDSLRAKDYFAALLKGDYKKHLKEIEGLLKDFYGDKGESYLRKKISKCSSGEQKKLSIIGALIRKNKKLYFFDEPMNCLDTNSMKTFMGKVKDLMETQPDSAVVIITHCLLFDNPDKVYKISNGKLIDDTANYQKRDCLDYLTK